MKHAARAPIRSLTLVLPALNEEEAIARTLHRCLAAREALLKETVLTSVRLVVVSDGSTDRTAGIARSIDGVDVIELERHTGYGAAIKEGWDHAPADLLAFMDADGTCDPLLFVPLCSLVIRDQFDIAVGNRMGATSRMSGIRRLGNTMFALLLGHLSRRDVGDAASGMRVLRSSVLPFLLPLPDGLHFTPAMSARALMDGLRIGEIAIPYETRIGRSKLRVFRDGFSFLGAILAATAYVRLSRLTLPIVGGAAVGAAALVASPSLYYFDHARLEEWMFYRIALALTLSTVALIVLCATIVGEHLSALARMSYRTFEPNTAGMWRYENLRILIIAATVVCAIGVLLNLDGLRQLFSSGHVTLHWSRVMLGSFAGVDFVVLLSTVGLLKIVRGLHTRQPHILTLR